MEILSILVNSDFSSSGSKGPFFFVLFQQHTLCFVSEFALQSLEIKKKKNETIRNFKNE